MRKTLEETVTWNFYLAEKGPSTVTTAESCTGGTDRQEHSGQCGRRVGRY